MRRRGATWMWRGKRQGTEGIITVMRSCRLPFLLMFLAAPLRVEAQDSLAQLQTRALELKARGDAAGSLAAWEKAAALAPQSAQIQDEIGFLLAVLNRRPEAIEHFKRAIELDPRAASPRYHLGVAYWLQEDPNDSIPQLQAAVEIDPKNFEYRFHLGHALNATSHPAEALTHAGCGHGARWQALGGLESAWAGAAEYG